MQLRFSTFFTTNFADTYHVLTEVLAQGAFEPLGPRPLNILQDSPPMPTSQTMHKILAARPMVQANLFLFLDAITLVPRGNVHSVFCIVSYFYLLGGHFADEEIITWVVGVYFPGLGIYFLGRGVYFLGRGVYLLGRGVYFLSRCVYF